MAAVKDRQYLREALRALAGLVLLPLLLSGCAALSSDCAERYVCPTLSIGIEIPLARTRDLPPPERDE